MENQYLFVVVRMTHPTGFPHFHNFTISSVGGWLVVGISFHFAIKRSAHSVQFSYVIDYSQRGYPVAFMASFQINLVMLLVKAHKKSSELFNTA